MTTPIEYAALAAAAVLATLSAKAITANVNMIKAVTPTTFAKSRKTKHKREFVRQAMEQDGAAIKAAE